jgi:hypothetical protein
MVETHGYAPVSHAAFRVNLINSGKSFFRFVVPERVNQSRGAIELLLGRDVAGDGKLDLTKFFRSVVPMHLHLLRAGSLKTENHDQNCIQKQPDELHTCTPFFDSHKAVKWQPKVLVTRNGRDIIIPNALVTSLYQQQQ